MKHSLIPAMLAALFLCVSAVTSQAVDLQIRGQWNMGFGLADTRFTGHIRNGYGTRLKSNNNDRFAVRQRLLLQLDAVASESLSGTVMFHIGPQKWGFGPQGGAMGADGVFVKVRQAYIDWKVPDTTIQTRMGIQNFAMPYAAGGSAVFDLRGASINSHVDFNENIGLTAMWFRPYNDNYTGSNDTDGTNGYLNNNDNAGYLDNMDLFALMLPVNYGGVSVTPWAMYGVQGRNAHNFDDYRATNFVDGAPAVTLSPYLNAMGGGGGLNVTDYGRTSKAYGGMFWAGLPVKIKTFDPWNIEFDVNYGWVESMGRFDVKTRNDDSDIRRGSSKREGWMAKALVGYKMDWGTPGIFGWYGSGDDGSVQNGSERMPSVCPYVWMTSFMGDGNLAWGPNGDYLDLNDSMAGTWGFGFQLSDMSFINKLTHTFRVAYWGGTNSPSMVKYMDSAYAWRAPATSLRAPI